MDKSITITLLRLYKHHLDKAETVKHRTILLSYCFRGGGAIYSETLFSGVPGSWFVEVRGMYYILYIYP